MPWTAGELSGLAHVPGMALTLPMGMRVAVCVVAAFTAFVGPDGGNCTY